MGVLRFFLALSVVFTHTGPFFGFFLGDGRLAVQSFYMISGFYMSMVWATKYSVHPNPIRTFYVSRALRIYPLYFTVLIFTILLALIITVPPLEYATEHPASLISKTWVFLTQISLIGMETSIFYGLQGYWISPVAWSLGLELTFYLLVPLLIPRPLLALVTLAVSLIARYATYAHMGWSFNSPEYSAIWSYRFFPFEISLFILGSFSYQFFSKYHAKFSPVLQKPEIHFLLLITLISYLCYFQLLSPRLGERVYWIYYGIVFLVLWVLFQNSKNSKFDGYIGELSYPVYMSHIPIFWVVSLYAKPQNTIYAVIPITLLVSMVLVRLQGAIDKYRHTLTKR